MNDRASPSSTRGCGPWLRPAPDLWPCRPRAGARYARRFVLSRYRRECSRRSGPRRFFTAGQGRAADGCQRRAVRFHDGYDPARLPAAARVRDRVLPQPVRLPIRAAAAAAPWTRLPAHRQVGFLRPALLHRHRVDARRLLGGGASAAGAGDFAVVRDTAVRDHRRRAVPRRSRAPAASSAYS
jgi:hypothetical protein